MAMVVAPSLPARASAKLCNCSRAFSVVTTIAWLGLRCELLQYQVACGHGTKKIILSSILWPAFLSKSTSAAKWWGHCMLGALTSVKPLRSNSAS